MRNPFSKSKTTEIYLKSLGKKKSKKDLDSLREEFYFYFKKASGDEPRKLFEAALFLQWREEFQYALQKGVSPNGKILCNEWAEKYARFQNQVRGKYDHPIASYLGSQSEYQLDWTPLTLSIFARDFEAVSQLWPHVNHTESLLLTDMSQPESERYLKWPPLFLLLNGLTIQGEKSEIYHWIEKSLAECQSVEELDPTRPYYAPTYIIGIRDAKAMQLLAPKITTWNQKDEDDETRLEWFLVDFQNNNHILWDDEDTVIDNNTLPNQLEIFQILLDHSDVSENTLELIHNNTELESMYAHYLKDNLSKQISQATTQSRSTPRI